MGKIKVLSLQTSVAETPRLNLENFEHRLSEAMTDGVNLVTLPEMFTCPYQTELFPRYAEEEGEESWLFCASLAKKYGVYLSAGSMPEKDGFCTYNTAYVFSPEGRCVAKHRKAHLFDINVRGQYYRESDTLSPGNHATVFDTPFGKIGLCVCYDIRFPELFRKMVSMGAVAVIIPAAFNMTTGPAHWELLVRARSVDNQLFTIATAPARYEAGKYVSWGHSIISDPWGRVIMQMDEKEGSALTEIDLDEIAYVREKLPVLKQRRPELY